MRDWNHNRSGWAGALGGAPSTEPPDPPPHRPSLLLLLFLPLPQALLLPLPQTLSPPQTLPPPPLDPLSTLPQALPFPLPHTPPPPPPLQPPSCSDLLAHRATTTHSWGHLVCVQAPRLHSQREGSSPLQDTLWSQGCTISPGSGTYLGAPTACPQPSCLQTTDASANVHSWLHTCPHCPLRRTSTTPSQGLCLYASLRPPGPPTEEQVSLGLEPDCGWRANQCQLGGMKTPKFAWATSKASVQSQVPLPPITRSPER